MIRQLSHGSFERDVGSDTYFHRLNQINVTTAANEPDPWILDAMEAFDAEFLDPLVADDPNISRDKAATPSQEILEQTKAAWKEQNHSSKILKEPPIKGYSSTFAQRSPRTSGSAQTPPRLRMRTPSNPLWSELQSNGKSTAMNRSSKHSTLMSERNQDQRQTRSFHGFSTANQSGNLESAKAKTVHTSQQLQAILGVESFQLLASNTQTDTSSRSPKGKKFASRLPVRTSSILPLHHRRESSVYGSGGPTTPPPSTPLPAIPSSASQASLRTASTNPLVLYTPTSPAASLGISANHWSWRLAPDSPGSQLLNEMKVATDISRVRCTEDAVIPTKRHVHQRSISSSALSAIMLEEISHPGTIPLRGITREQYVRKQDEQDPAKAIPNDRDVRRTDKAGANRESTGPASSLHKSSWPAPPKRAEDHPDSTTTSHSAGSPSSIVDLYMRRSQPNLTTEA